MHVLTYASRLESGFLPFVRSCERAGLAPLVLGYGEGWRGFGYRLRQVYGAARALRGTVLYVDAFDVVLAGSREEILSRYQSFGSPWVVNAETNCWPDLSRAVEYPDTLSRYRYLNAGAWIGEAEYIAEQLAAAGADRVPDDLNDQRFLTDLFLSDPSRLTLDTGCRLFQTLYRAGDDLHQADGVWRNLDTDSAPLIFHGNGGAEMSFLHA